MALKSFKPVTPSLRQLVIVDRSDLWKGKPVKTLTEGKSQKGGRNNHGRITVRFRGGGHKQSYRLVDFKRRKLDVAATVERLAATRQPWGTQRCANARAASSETRCPWRRSWCSAGARTSSSAPAVAAARCVRVAARAAGPRHLRLRHHGAARALVAGASTDLLRRRALARGSDGVDARLHRGMHRCCSR